MNDTHRTSSGGLLPADELHSTFPLAQTNLVSSSLQIMALQSRLRRALGHTVAVAGAKTYGELEERVVGNQIDSPVETRSDAPATARDSENQLPLDGCGIDLEDVDALPVADDYWEDEFYRDHFTEKEIAYCQLQSQPRQHFAVRWCAKEALRKADRRFLHLPFNHIEVCRSPDVVHLALVENGNSQLLPHRVSLTHTEQHAAAVVVISPTTDSSRSTTPQANGPPADQSVASNQSSSARNHSHVALSMAISALIIGSVALLQAFGLLANG